MQPVLAYAATHLDEDVSLAALARQFGLSAFHLQRVFAGAFGETPKRLTVRLRLECASVMLLTGGDTVLDIALACGFQSHEVFCRGFRRYFGITPSAYRERGFVNATTARQAADHAAIVGRVGPCVGIYHISTNGRSQRTEMTYTVTKVELSPQPVLVVRRRVKRSEIAAAIGEALPNVFLHAQQNGLALAGLPFTRYIEVGPGLMTIEPGMRVAASGQDPNTIDPAWTQTSAAANVALDTLPGGPAATTIHMGPYEQLPDAYAAIQQWVEAQGLVPTGAPWECYITDPSEHPDPKDWKTEVFWPVA